MFSFSNDKINVMNTIKFYKMLYAGWRGRNRGRRSVRARGIQGRGRINDFQWNFHHCISHEW